MISAEITIASSDFGHLEPMINANQTELKAAGADRRAAGRRRGRRLLASEAMEAVINDGIQDRSGPTPASEEGLEGIERRPRRHMRRVLETDLGGAPCRKRKRNPAVSADTRFNRRIDRFQRRGGSCRPPLRGAFDKRHSPIFSKLHKHG